MEKPQVLDKVYTSEEAAARLRISTRAVIKVGRDYFFSEEDLLRLWTAIRVEPTRSALEHHVVRLPDPWHKDDLLWLASGRRRSTSFESPQMVE